MRASAGPAGLSSDSGLGGSTDGSSDILVFGSVVDSVTEEGENHACSHIDVTGFMHRCVCVEKAASIYAYIKRVDISIELCIDSVNVFTYVSICA